MYCAKCGCKMQSGDKFCGRCGTVAAGRKEGEVSQGPVVPTEDKNVPVQPITSAVVPKIPAADPKHGKTKSPLVPGVIVLVLLVLIAAGVFDLSAFLYLSFRQSGEL